MSKGNCFILLVCVGVSTFLLTSQFVHWVKPLDYYLPEGADATTYFNYQDVVQLMLVGGFVFFTLSLIWKRFKPNNLLVGGKLASITTSTRSVRRRRGEPV